MDREELVTLMKTQLGYPINDIELEDSVIDAIIKLAIIDYQPYYSEMFLYSQSYQSKIDLNQVKLDIGESKDIYDIIKVCPLRDLGTDVGDISLFNSSYTHSTIDIYTNRDMWRAAWDFYNSADNTYDPTLDFRYDRITNTLWVSNPTRGSCQRITIYYLMKIKIEMLSDKHLNYFLQLMVAHAKIILGRMRTKFQIPGLPITFDGDTILNEGTSDLNNLRQVLKDSAFVFYADI